MSNVSALGYLQKSDDLYSVNCVNVSVSGELANKAANVTTAVRHDDVTIVAAKMITKYTKIGTAAAAPYNLALDTGAHLSAAIPNATAGYMFELVLHEIGGQVCTLAGAGGTTLVSASADIAANKICILKFVCTGADAWTVFKWE
jgi:hypothetical protein